MSDIIQQQKEFDSIVPEVLKAVKTVKDLKEVINQLDDDALLVSECWEQLMVIKMVSYDIPSKYFIQLQEVVGAWEDSFDEDGNYVEDGEL